MDYILPTFLIAVLIYGSVPNSIQWKLNRAIVFAVSSLYMAYYVVAYAVTFMVYRTGRFIAMMPIAIAYSFARLGIAMGERHNEPSLKPKLPYGEYTDPDDLEA